MLDLHPAIGGRFQHVQHHILVQPAQQVGSGICTLTQISGATDQYGTFISQ